jgi:predicted DNA-binding transcriptional regulator AlpA
MSEHQHTAGTDRLLTMRDALLFLGISRSNAYRLLAENQIPRPIKLGARNYFSQRELQEWFETKLQERDVEIDNAN